MNAGSADDPEAGAAGGARLPVRQVVLGRDAALDERRAVRQRDDPVLQS
jgi:hypothetical protein